jgi:hypothetical protein
MRLFPSGRARLWVLRAPDEIALPEIAPKHLEVVDRDAISYWSAGPPNYRWNEVMFELFSSSDADVVPERVAAALHIAINDAVVAADHYAPRAAVRAAAAGAAGTGLSQLFPGKAADIATKADAAARAGMPRTTTR